jgi:threonine aldolase
VLTRRGDEVVASRESHAGWHEVGGAAANAGVQIVEIGRGGSFSVDELLAAIKPAGLPVFPTTTLMEIENTHNRSGGVVLPQALVDALCAAARGKGLATFLDGARLWNAHIASGVPLATMAAPFDLVTVAFSKGLGAPGGSLLAGPKAMIVAADRHRRRLGGAMRQNGIFAAAALHGMDHHLARLADDHAHARLLAERLVAGSGVQLDLATVQSNIIVFHLPAALPDAATVVARAREQGVLVSAFGPRTVRAVTHLDVTRMQCERAAAVLVELLAA